jgi:MFS family permease
VIDLVDATGDAVEGAAGDAAAPSAEPFRVSRTTNGAFRQWYMVAALTVLSTVAMVDRMAMALVLDLIKGDLKLTDTDLGVLVGASFTLFYLLVTFPMGWVVDRFNRKWLLIVGGVFWSVCTICTGTAHSFWRLFAGRAGVGFAEGGVTPATFSMIRDGVSADRRGRAFAIYGASASTGGALALILSGAVLAVATAIGPIEVPILGLMKPWQMVFVALGLGGLPFVALMLFVREPGRTGAGVADRGGYGGAFRYMVANWRIYLPLMAFNAMLGMTTGGFAFWMPTIAHRVYGTPLKDVAQIMAFVVLVGPGIGLWCFGSAVDWLTKRGVRNGPGLMIALGAVLTLIPAVVTPLMPNATAYWIAYFAFTLVAGSVVPATQVINARITPSQSAGKISVLYALPQSILSIVGGGIIVGRMSDNIFSGPKALAYAVSLNSAIFAPAALLCAWWLVVRTRSLIPVDELTAENVELGPAS